jgi:hypothetical protein
MLGVNFENSKVVQKEKIAAKSFDCGPLLVDVGKVSMTNPAVPHAWQMIRYRQGAKSLDDNFDQS